MHFVQIPVLAEVSGSIDVAQYARCLFVKARPVEGHCLPRQTKISDRKCGKSLPLAHQAVVFQALLQQGEVELSPAGPKRPAPVTDLAKPDSLLEEVLQDMHEQDENIVVRHRRRHLCGSNLLQLPAGLVEDILAEGIQIAVYLAGKTAALGTVKFQFDAAEEEPEEAPAEE